MKTFTSALSILILAASGLAQTAGTQNPVLEVYVYSDPVTQTLYATAVVQSGTDGIVQIYLMDHDNPGPVALLAQGVLQGGFWLRDFQLANLQTPRLRLAAVVFPGNGAPLTISPRVVVQVKTPPAATPPCTERSGALYASDATGGRVRIAVDACPGDVVRIRDSNGVVRQTIPIGQLNTSPSFDLPNDTGGYDWTVEIDRNDGHGFQTLLGA